ncbi:MAG: hypothetical protein SW833_21305 [Cyanobacteriota bacterium]|nr:hypothetical protein [Cyanobacteriota bacterium]
MFDLNQSASESSEKVIDLPLGTIEALSGCLLEELGEPSTEWEEQALRSLLNGHYDAAKRFGLHDPCNSYLAAISCMASAFRSPVVADSVLRDAARHASDVAKKRAEARIADQFQRLLP